MITTHQPVGLDVETEQLLQAVIHLTGLSPLEALKQGLILLQQRFKNQTDLQQFDLFLVAIEASSVQGIAIRWISNFRTTIFNIQ